VKYFQDLELVALAYWLNQYLDFRTLRQRLLVASVHCMRQSQISIRVVANVVANWEVTFTTDSIAKAVCLCSVDFGISLKGKFSNKLEDGFSG
jgi:hypothetical protein